MNFKIAAKEHWERYKSFLDDTPRSTEELARLHGVGKAGLGEAMRYAVRMGLATETFMAKPRKPGFNTSLWSRRTL